MRLPSISSIMSLFTVDNLYTPNQVYNLATAVVVASNFVYEKSIGKTPNTQEHLIDVAIHLGQALLRRDGYFGLKIEVLNIDWKISIPGAKNSMRLANAGRIAEIIYRTQLSSTTIAAQANLIDGGLNHAINLIVGEAAGKEAPHKYKRMAK